MFACSAFHVVFLLPSVHNHFHDLEQFISHYTLCYILENEFSKRHVLVGFRKTKTTIFSILTLQINENNNLFCQTKS